MSWCFARGTLTPKAIHFFFLRPEVSARFAVGVTLFFPFNHHFSLLSAKAHTVVVFTIKVSISFPFSLFLSSDPDVGNPCGSNRGKGKGRFSPPPLSLPEGRDALETGVPEAPGGLVAPAPELFCPIGAREGQVLSKRRPLPYATRCGAVVGLLTPRPDFYRAYPRLPPFEDKTRPNVSHVF